LGNLRTVVLPTGTRIDYVIDGANRRIGKKVNGVLVKGFLYQNGLRPIAELDGNNQVVARFVYAGKINVPEYMIKGGAAWRLITDHLGSVRLVVNIANGQVAQRLDYDEYGRVLQDTHPGFQPFGFDGGLYDPDNKLVRFGARDYDAEIGRWLNRDPIGEWGGINLYGFVGNNPVNFVDPFGLVDYPPGFIGPRLPSPGLPDPNWKPRGWNPNWPEGYDKRGPFYEDPNSGDKWYPHPEDPSHWPHYDSDKGTRFPDKCLKPKPNQKRPPYGKQNPTNPWPKPPAPPPWWRNIPPFWRWPMLIPRWEGDPNYFRQPQET
jgi:RHS repeat-associated protein